MNGPTIRQRAVLATIAKHIAVEGYPPTLRELCVMIGVRSTNAACDHIRLLKLKGLLSRDASAARSIRVTDEGWEAAGVPKPAHQMPKPLRREPTGTVILPTRCAECSAANFDEYAACRLCRRLRRERAAAPAAELE